jgi:hypothetical protein
LCRARHQVDPSEIYPLNAHPAGHPLEAAAMAMLQAAVQTHRTELGTPPPGVLADVCKTSDCRVCCDHAKNCDCSPKPPSLAEAMASGFGL